MRFKIRYSPCPVNSKTIYQTFYSIIFFTCQNDDSVAGWTSYVNRIDFNLFTTMYRSSLNRDDYYFHNKWWWIFVKWNTIEITAQGHTVNIHNWHIQLTSSLLELISIFSRQCIEVNIYHSSVFIRRRATFAFGIPDFSWNKIIIYTKVNEWSSKFSYAIETDARGLFVCWNEEIFFQYTPWITHADRDKSF